MALTSSLLYSQVVENPDDTTLLRAYADALIEDGYEKRAETVKELVQVQEDIEGHPDAAPFSLRSRQFILKRRLLILPLCPGDLVTTDESGRIIPLIGFAGYCHLQQIGEVVRCGDDGRVQVLIWTATGHPVGNRGVL